MLISRIQSMFRRKVAPGPASTDGRVIFAVGDIHGRSDLLQILLTEIRNRPSPPEITTPPVLIFLGDYVDRGPDSARAIDIIIEAERDLPFEIHPLRGNHELQMRRFLDDAQAGRPWANFGGLETLKSYGAPLPRPDSSAEEWEAARIALNEALPPSHREFLDRLETTVVIGDYVFVHAGLRPGVALADQTEEDMLWIRDEFLSARGGFEKLVVHGHTPEAEVQITDTRIGIDTGAYATGRLTAVRLFNAEREILQACL